MHPFIHLSIGFWLYTALQCRSSMSSNCLVFHTSGGISSSPAAFLFLIFLRTDRSHKKNSTRLMIAGTNARTFGFTFIICPSIISQNTLLVFYLADSWFFLVIFTRSGHLAEMRRSVCISKSLRNFCISFSTMNFVFCINHSFVWSNLKFLHNSLWNTFSNKSWLVFYFRGSNFLHSRLMGLIIPSLSPYNLHLLFCFASDFFIDSTYIFLFRLMLAGTNARTFGFNYIICPSIISQNTIKFLSNR